VTVSVPWFRPAALGVAVLFAVTGAAPLASAGEPVVKAGPQSSTLAAQAAAKAAALKPASSARLQTASTPSSSAPDNRSFFKTPTGIAALLLMAAGATYVAVSIGHDNSKVHSPIR
jgi:hypothetical protein